MVARTVVALAVVAAAGGAGTFAPGESRTGRNASPHASVAAVSGPARIAFSHAGAIWTIKPDGSDRRRIAAGADPAWSPDGQLLAFVRERDRRGTIWVAAPDGSGARQVAADLEATLGDPAWSPDASQLAYSRLKLGASAETSIDVVRRDGSLRRAVISQPLHETFDVASEPVWMPDGRSIAYTRATHVVEGRYRLDIRVVDLGGSGDRVFLEDATGGAWSPDGRRFAYGDTRNVAGDVCGSDECSPAADIAIAEADGSDRKVLLRTATDENDPSWSGDGTRIAFSSGRNVPDRRASRPRGLRRMDRPRRHGVGRPAGRRASPCGRAAPTRRRSGSVLGLAGRSSISFRGEGATRSSPTATARPMSPRIARVSSCSTDTTAASASPSGRGSSCAARETCVGSAGH